MNRVDRLLAYLLHFQNQPLVRARDLAQKFEISERTVYRDIDALCEVGVPLYGTPGEGYRLLDGYYLPPIMFTEEEGRTLFLAVELLLAQTTPGRSHATAESALAKIRTVLPTLVRQQLETLQAVLSFYTIANPKIDFDDPRFDEIYAAIQAHRVMRIHYHAVNNNQVTVREIEPHAFAIFDQAVVVRSFCRLRQARRNFRLDRIDQLELLAEQFEPPAEVPSIPEIGPDKRRAVVRFAPSISRSIKERQHYACTSEEETPAGFIAVYAGFSHPNLARWLLQWGAAFEVLEPPSLREHVAEIARELWERHH